MSADYTYLASPYTHNDPAIREKRFKQVCEVAAALMLKGENIFCPIAHSHPIGEVIKGYATNGAFWKKQDIPLLRHASMLKVVCLDGWHESSGVRWEIALARELNIPVEYIYLKEDKRDWILDAQHSVLYGTGNAIRFGT